jgi:type IV pilus assembly protein PilY1
LNAGGRSIYALDVTDPGSFSESNVLWEFDASDDANLGLTFSRPQIGVLESGQWVAVFGNGYNSPGGGSYLFIVDLATGALLQRLTARDVAGDENNGLSTPVLIDKDANGFIDTAYAGDLQGFLWKFDLGGASSADWNVANNVALFRGIYGGRGQPITAQPKVAGHPSSGRLILFGTGRYLTNSDVYDMTRQSYYGIWDNDTFTTRALRSNLQPQTFDLQEEASGRMVRSVSSNTVDWGTRRGWYIDLLDGAGGTGEIGERVVNTSLVIRDLVLFSTIIPSTDPCDPGGTSWLMALKVDTGGSFSRALFDLDGNGEFDSVVEDDAGDDQYVNALRTDRLGISNVPVVIVEDATPSDPNDDPVLTADVAFAIGTGTSGETETNRICLRAEGCDEAETPPPPPSGPVKRRSWIQIR